MTDRNEFSVDAEAHDRWKKLLRRWRSIVIAGSFVALGVVALVGRDRLDEYLTFEGLFGPLYLLPYLLITVLAAVGEALQSRANPHSHDDKSSPARGLSEVPLFVQWCIMGVLGPIAFRVWAFYSTSTEGIPDFVTLIPVCILSGIVSLMFGAAIASQIEDRLKRRNR